MSSARFLFAGTPEFALASLRALYDAGHSPVAVLTQPDRPAGRGKKLTASPVKKFALAHSIPVWQPATLKDPDAVQQIKDAEPQLLIVAAYGLILPQVVLDIPTEGCLNVHASLLPRWRGAAPIQQAILNGDQETGICLMKMEAGLDTGPVFVRDKITIGDRETAGELHDRLASLGGDLLVENIGKILAREIDAKPQNESLATYAEKIKKQDARINWNETTADNLRKIRAYNPVPGASFEFDNEIAKCFNAHEVDVNLNGALPGTVVAADRGGVDVACANGVLRLTEVQRPGRKPVSAGEFAAQLDLVGKTFGWVE